MQTIDRLPPLPTRPPDAHKGVFGTVLVVGGSATMIGAPALCASGALRSGAGLVRLAVPAPILAAAITIEPGTCPRGFMHGRWMNHPERQGGFLKGRWETENGGVKGHMKGIYGVNDAGEKVFFGKMISRSGRFLGIVVGHYDKHPDDENGGWFQGRIVNRNREIIGGIKGEWKRSEHCNGGLFRARWGLNCNVDTES